MTSPTVLFDAAVAIFGTGAVVAAVAAVPQFRVETARATPAQAAPSQASGET